MKCNILAHEFNTSSNGNLYCKLEVKPANEFQLRDVCY